MGVVAAAALVAAGCANPAVSASGARSVFAQGVITAKGSVWVNGVEYHTTGTGVSVDGAASGDDGLKVGMYVALRAVYDPVSARWKAEQVDYESEIKGFVTEVGASSFTVLSTTVDVDALTVFEGTADLAHLAVHDFVEVSGQPGTTAGHLLATRVEVKTADSRGIKVSGEVTGLTTTETGGSFVLNFRDVLAFTVTYTGTLDAGIADGSRVRILLQASDLDVGAQTASVAASAVQRVVRHAAPRRGDQSEYRGLVSGLDASGDPVTFRLGGRPVSVPRGVLAGRRLAEGDRVEVEGSVGDDGVLVASRLHREWDAGDLRELRGTVTAVDLTASTLTVQPPAGGPVVFHVGNTVLFSSDGWFGADPLAKVSLGTAVEVKYWIDASVNQALKIESQTEQEDEGHGHH